MNLIYENSNLSGIGDRLIDLILVYTFSKLNNYNNVYLNWRIDTDLGSNIDKWYSHRTNRTPFRKIDYLQENMLNFLEYPKNIKFVSNDELNILKNDNNNKVFSSYLGGTSVFDFINKFNIQDNDFEQKYYDNFKKIKFINIPNDIIKIFENKVITIHLRRGDKVDEDANGTNGVNNEQLYELDYKTRKFIDNEINLGNKNICFISDEKKIRDNYINLYENKCNVIVIEGDEISQTYYDLYAMAHSEKILMSQKLSCFSILGTLLGNGELYYFYKEGRFKELGFNLYKKFKKI